MKPLIAILALSALCCSAVPPKNVVFGKAPFYPPQTDLVQWLVIDDDTNMVSMVGPGALIGALEVTATNTPDVSGTYVRPVGYEIIPDSIIVSNDTGNTAGTYEYYGLLHGYNSWKRNPDVGKYIWSTNPGTYWMVGTIDDFGPDLEQRRAGLNYPSPRGWYIDSGTYGFVNTLSYYEEADYYISQLYTAGSPWYYYAIYRASDNVALFKRPVSGTVYGTYDPVAEAGSTGDVSVAYAAYTVTQTNAVYTNVFDSTWVTAGEFIPVTYADLIAFTNNFGTVHTSYDPDTGRIKNILTYSTAQTNTILDLYLEVMK